MSASNYGSSGLQISRRRELSGEFTLVKTASFTYYQTRAGRAGQKSPRRTGPSVKASEKGWEIEDPGHVRPPDPPPPSRTPTTPRTFLARMRVANEKPPTELRLPPVKGVRASHADETRPDGRDPGGFYLQLTRGPDRVN